MTLNSVNIPQSLEALKAQLAEEEHISPTLKSMIEMQMLIIELLVNQLGLNSKNSSKPPSSDINKLKPTRKPSAKKSG